MTAYFIIYCTLLWCILCFLFNCSDSYWSWLSILSRTLIFYWNWNIRWAISLYTTPYFRFYWLIFVENYMRRRIRNKFNIRAFAMICWQNCYVLFMQVRMIWRNVYYLCCIKGIWLYIYCYLFMLFIAVLSKTKRSLFMTFLGNHWWHLLMKFSFLQHFMIITKFLLLSLITNFSLSTTITWPKKLTIW